MKVAFTVVMWIEHRGITQNFVNIAALNGKDAPIVAKRATIARPVSKHICLIREPKNRANRVNNSCPTASCVSIELPAKLQNQVELLLQKKTKKSSI